MGNVFKASRIEALTDSRHKTVHGIGGRNDICSALAWLTATSVSLVRRQIVRFLPSQNTAMAVTGKLTETVSAMATVSGNAS